MPSNCPSVAHLSADTTNVTALIYDQYKNAPKDDWDRLLKQLLATLAVQILRHYRR